MNRIYPSFLALLLTTVSSPALAALSMDGTPQTGSNTSTAIVSAAAFTTSNSNDVIIMLTADAAANAATVSSVSGCSLTWTKRTAQTWGAGGTFDMEEWYAIAASPLSACTISATYTAAATYSSRIFVFAVSGANTTTPFDVNGSLPLLTQAVDTTKNISGTISTTNTDTFIIGYIGGLGGLGTITYPSGFANILTGGSTTNPSKSIVASAQSSVAEQWSWTGTTTARALLIDAVQAASPAPAPAPAPAPSPAPPSPSPPPTILNTAF